MSAAGGCGDHFDVIRLLADGEAQARGRSHSGITLQQLTSRSGTTQANSWVPPTVRAIQTSLTAVYGLDRIVRELVNGGM